ncbi:hypothetical protein D8M34_10120, partial [Microbacterium sp. HSID17254]|uniref:hypothetical protein n=1 Tax=Microbacterium sp. HSID17254 TaxID=2419509 RepID=UPI000FB8A06C
MGVLSLLWKRACVRLEPSAVGLELGELEVAVRDVGAIGGGSTIVSALSGWVDPEGDAFVLSDAYETDSSSPVMVAPMADG